MIKPLGVLAMMLVLAGSSPAKIVDRIVAQVNDDIITLSDLNREMAAIRQQLATQFSGEQLEAEAKKAEKEALDSLIRDKLLLQKANELGFNASVDTQVAAAIERIRKENNIKDMQEFERLLGQQGMTMPGFRDQIRKRIIIDSLVDSFVRSRITLLSNEIERYYRDHAADFTSIEEVTLSEIVIPIEGDAAAAQAKAAEVHKRAVSGEAFATLANQFSKGTTAAKGGSIGNYVTRKLNPEIARAIAKVKDGEVTDIQTTKEGLVIYRVDSRKEAARMPLEEVKQDIQQRIFSQKFNPELERFVTQLKEDAYIQIFADAK